MKMRVGLVSSGNTVLLSEIRLTGSLRSWRDFARECFCFNSEEARQGD